MGCGRSDPSRCGLRPPRAPIQIVLSWSAARSPASRNWAYWAYLACSCRSIRPGSSRRLRWRRFFSSSCPSNWYCGQGPSVARLGAAGTILLKCALTRVKGQLIVPKRLILLGMGRFAGLAHAVCQGSHSSRQFRVMADHAVRAQLHHWNFRVAKIDRDDGDACGTGGVDVGR